MLLLLPFSQKVRPIALVLEIFVSCCSFDLMPKVRLIPQPADRSVHRADPVAGIP